MFFDQITFGCRNEWAVVTDSVTESTSSHVPRDAGRGSGDPIHTAGSEPAHCGAAPSGTQPDAQARRCQPH